jgi:hypothetical protein
LAGVVAIVVYRPHAHATIDRASLASLRPVVAT